MNEKKTLSQLLRTAEVYQETDLNPPDTTWRQALLEDFDHAAIGHPSAQVEPERTPLQPHHLLMMAPAGAGLFLAGWLVGKGPAAVELLGNLPPTLWMVLAAVASLSFLGWRGLPGSRR